MLRSALRTPALRTRLPSYAPARTLARPLTTHVPRAEAPRVVPRLTSAPAELRRRLLVTGACVSGVRTFHATSRNQSLPILPLLAGILKVRVETSRAARSIGLFREAYLISKITRHPPPSRSCGRQLASHSRSSLSFSSRTTRSRGSSRMQRRRETMPWRSAYARSATKRTYSTAFSSYPSSSSGRQYLPALNVRR